MPKKSITDIVKERNQAVFVGREEQIRQFEENLELTEDDERRRFIINITGQGGVGKTWLGNQFVQRMQQKKIITAKVDWDVRDVVDVLSKFAEQIQEQGHKFKRFDGRYKTYLQKKQELEADPNAPDDIANVIGRWAAKSVFSTIETIPGATIFTSLVDKPAIENEAGKGLRFLMKKITNKDEQELLLNPAKILTPLFLEDLSDLPDNCMAGLWIDTYEQTCSLLDEWLRQIYHGDLGEPPLNLLLIISGRDQLDKNDWADFQSILLHFPLEPFNEQEARNYLAKKEITEENDIQIILRLSMRLPVLLQMLAEQRKNSQGEIEDFCDSAIERFLRWINDPAKRDLALNAALPRFINQDVIAQLIDPEKASVMFEWLCTQPFVQKHGNYWLYHDFVRDLMLRYKRQLNPNGWSKVHESLARYYEQKRDELGLVEKAGMHNSEWQNFSLEVAYHRICQSSTRNITSVLAGFIASMMISNDFDLCWAKTIQKAEQDCEITGKSAWGIDLLEGIEAYHLHQNYDKNIHMLNRLLENSFCNDFQREILFIWLGIVYSLSRNYTQAIVNTTRALELKPQNALYYLLRGINYYLSGDYAQGIADQTRGIELDPQNALRYLLRGISYNLSGDYEQAIADQTCAIELGLRNAVCYFLRGVNYSLSEDYARAIADQTCAIELDSQNARYFDGRSTSYHLSGNYAQAIADQTCAIELDPQNARYFDNRSISYHASGDYARAISDETRAIELDPQNARYFDRRSASYHASGDYARAISDETCAIELDPQNARYFDSRSASYRASGDYVRAISDETCAIELDPQNAEYYFSRGAHYYASVDCPRAIADATRAIELDQQNAQYFDGRSRVYYAFGDYPRAIADATRAIELDPEMSRAYNVRGRSYRKSEMFDLAFADHQRAIEFSPEDDWYQYQFALLLIKQGQIDLAKFHLSAAIRVANTQLCEPIQDWDNAFSIALYHLACGEDVEALKRYTELVQTPQAAGFIEQAIRHLQELEEVLADGRAQEMIARIQAQRGDKSSYS